MNILNLSKYTEYLNVLVNKKSRYIYNKNHLEYNQQIAPIINNLCAPLLNLEIKTFTFSRIYDGGRRLYICSDQEWVKEYITREFQDELNHMSHYVPLKGINYALWQGFKNDKVFEAAHQHNMWNGISIYEAHSEYVDYFDFAFLKTDNYLTNTYINNINLFQRFVEYFKDRSSLIIDYTDKKNCLFPRKFITFNNIPRKEYFPLNTSNVLSTHATEGNKIRRHNEAYNLSPRELSCLELLADGKSIKEISSNLKLAPRTVQSYIHMSKMRFNSETIEELLRFYMHQLKGHTLLER